MNIDSTIKSNTLIEDIINLYPHVVDFLVEEYGFYCFQCFLSSYETLEEGAKAHGIKGGDFQEMLDNIQKFLDGDIEIDS